MRDALRILWHDIRHKPLTVIGDAFCVFFGYGLAFIVFFVLL